MIKKIKALFKFKPFSKKQRLVLNWWTGDSPVKNENGIIADGAIRSGKTVSMAISFVMWAMETFDLQNFAMCGKTIGSFKRNVWFWLKLMLISRGYKIKKFTEMGDNCYAISRKGITNYFYMFGGKDERSQDLIQGLTLAGILFDEVALMPESFVNQATARCSVEDSKLWFNCNPQGPLHWFKVNWIGDQEEGAPAYYGKYNKCQKRKLLYLHFTQDDNLTLSEEKKAFYRSQYIGVFFKRYILGLWVMAEGAIYDMFHDGLLFDDESGGPNMNLFYRRFYPIDYGTTNACVFLEVIQQDKINYVVDEYYYDSKKSGRQKSDDEYADDLAKFIGDKRYDAVILDPSAASFKVAARQKGIRIREADNEVLDGIRLVSSLFNLSMLKIHKKCVNLRNEISSYIWDEKAAQRGEEQPVKLFDHACDALRYFCKTIVKYIPSMR